MVFGYDGRWKSIWCKSRVITFVMMREKIITFLFFLGKNHIFAKRMGMIFFFQWSYWIPWLISVWISLLGIIWVDKSWGHVGIIEKSSSSGCYYFCFSCCFGRWPKKNSWQLSFVVILIYGGWLDYNNSLSLKLSSSRLNFSTRENGADWEGLLWLWVIPFRSYFI